MESLIYVAADTGTIFAMELPLNQTLILMDAPTTFAAENSYSFTVKAQKFQRIGPWMKLIPSGKLT
jgi:hypothetical protein